MPKKKAAVSRKALKSRVRVVMAERGIHTITELSRRLKAIHLDVSKYQLGRFIDSHTPLWNPWIIAGLLTVLDCELTDLWEVTLVDAATDEKKRQAEKESRRQGD